MGKHLFFGGFYRFWGAGWPGPDRFPVGPYKHGEENVKDDQIADCWDKGKSLICSHIRRQTREWKSNVNGAKETVCVGITYFVLHYLGLYLHEAKQNIY